VTRRALIPESSTASDASPATGSGVARHATALNAIALRRGLAIGEKAAFLWMSRKFVARSSTVTFADLASLDDRLSRLVYQLSERPVLAEFLLRNENDALKPGLAFVAAVVALRSGGARIFNELVMRLESNPALLSPLGSALAWLEYDELGSCVERLLAAQSPAIMQLGLFATVAHHVDPGETLARALDEDDLTLRASALEAVGRLGSGHHQPRLRAALGDDDQACRFWGAWSGVRLGDQAGIPVLGRFAASAGLYAGPACDVALRALAPDHGVRAHARLLSMTNNKRLGVRAAGIIGDPGLASWLLDEMESESLARPAAAAFCLMTGRDLRRDDLDSQDPPKAVLERPSQDRTEVEREMEPPRAALCDLTDESDDGLAWPDTARLRGWWSKNRHRFVAGTRHLAGVPVRREGLASVLASGNQQQRAAAAMELALLDADKPLTDVTAPSYRQV
jgi:uncharacterized protein (TIGR02270 family)